MLVAYIINVLLPFVSIIFLFAMYFSPPSL